MRKKKKYFYEVVYEGSGDNWFFSKKPTKKTIQVVLDDLNSRWYGREDPVTYEEFRKLDMFDLIKVKFED